MATRSRNLRVMVDANVLVAGMGWPRWPYALLQHAVAGDFRLALSPFVIKEARQHLGRIAPTTLPNLETFLRASGYEAIADPTPDEVAAHLHLVRDPGDVPIALAAIQAAVDCLVTNDKDMTESEALKQQVTVLLPAVFLRDRMGWTSEELETIRRRNWSDLR